MKPATSARRALLSGAGALFLLAFPSVVDCTVCVEHSNLGCYHDSGGLYNSTGRVLDGYIYNPNDGQSQAMTHELCMNVCNDRGYKFAGLEASYQCFCGDQINPALVPLEDGCDYPCEGNSQQECGGYWQVTVLNYTCSGVPDGKSCLSSL
jgi:hypothetical protein